MGGTLRQPTPKWLVRPQPLTISTCLEMLITIWLKFYMGIDVDSSKCVTFNGTHEHRVVTDPHRPALRWEHDELSVMSIFRRVQTHDTQDGNPFIFALKGLKGYSISYSNIKPIVLSAKFIINRELSGQLFDYVVPMPSSARLTRSMSSRIASIVQGDVLSPLRKITTSEALAQMPDISTVERNHRRDYGSLLKALRESSGDTLLQMKAVDKRIRKHISPIVASPKAPALPGSRVMIVDDIFASGASLSSAARALKGLGAADVVAVTLLGKL